MTRKFRPMRSAECCSDHNAEPNKTISRVANAVEFPELVAENFVITGNLLGKTWQNPEGSPRGWPECRSGLTSVKDRSKFPSFATSRRVASTWSRGRTKDRRFPSLEFISTASANLRGEKWKTRRFPRYSFFFSSFSYCSLFSLFSTSTSLCPSTRPPCRELNKIYLARRSSLHGISSHSGGYRRYIRVCRDVEGAGRVNGATTTGCSNGCRVRMLALVLFVLD